MKQLMSRGGFMRVSLAIILLLGLIGGGVAFFWSNGQHLVSSSANASEGEGGGEPVHVAIQVKTVKPHFDKAFSMIEKRPADVRAYYEDDLKTRVAGPISMIRTDKGDTVAKGEVLVEVDVPDLKARAEQQEAAWKLAQAQVKQKLAMIDTVKADMRAADSKIKSTSAKLRSDVAYEKFREKQAQRFRDLLAARSIEARLVDEQEDRLEAAIEAVNASKEAVETAKAQRDAYDARLEQARADLTEAERKVDVAKAEWDYARAMLSYGTVRAPFDGTISRRNVDPGSFVQNASNGQTTPLLSIQRTDIVTVVMRVPDNFATYIRPDTEVIFETHQLPGVKIHGKVTRYPDSLKNPEHDRTLVVEVDLWNGTKEEFDKVKNDPQFRAGLKKGMKGDPNNGMPIMPEFKDESGKPLVTKKQGELNDGRQLHLRPGMWGQMTLLLRTFDDTYLLPSSAIVSEGGNTYIYVVKDGKAHLQQVRVQVDDGKLVKVERLGKNGEVLGDLEGTEEVIVTNQGELSEGQLVQPTVIQDWRKLAVKKESH